jgi:hypothetical protein
LKGAEHEGGGNRQAGKSGNNESNAFMTTFHNN